MTRSRIYIVRFQRCGWPWFGVSKLVFRVSKKHIYSFWMIGITNKFSIGIHFNV
jgi:hypothetical protein